jgi:hypothetical protein
MVERNLQAMAQPAHPADQRSESSAPLLTIIRGADDQAAAYEALLAQWQEVDPEEDEREWEQIRAALEETRRTLHQRPLFAE